MLRGRDIARYRANWAGLWLIDTHNGYAGAQPIDVGEYPAVKAHLNRFIGHLERRNDKGVTPYNLRNCAYHDEFLAEKVIWIELVDQGRFAYDDSGVFVEATTFMMIGKHMKYHCALLNSTLVHWFMRKTAPTSGMGITRWKKVYVERVPIALPPPPVAAKMNGLVEEAQSLLNNASHLEQVERQIDSKVYEIYGLSDREVAIIASSMNSGT